MATKARDAFRTISEVADWLDVPAHVLRFWESKFSQIKPVKRAGGRRYYRPDDMMLIGGIKKLLHDDGMTIRGVQKMLKEDGVKAVSALSLSLDSVDEAASPRTIQRKAAAPDIEDAVEETSPEDNSLPAEDEVAVAAWEADAKSEAAAPQDREPLEIETSSAHEPAEEEVAAKAADEEPGEAPEAPFIDVEEEKPQFGGDNIVELPSRVEDPEPDVAQAPEPEIAAAPEPQTQPEPQTDDADAQIDASEPDVQGQPDIEAAAPAEASDPSPQPVEEVFQLSEAQLATQALKRKLRGSRASTGDVEALAPHVARMQALRDRLAHDLSGQ